jgi:hypothetical protein
MNEAHTIASSIVRFTSALYVGASRVPLGTLNFFSISERTSRGVRELSIQLRSGSPTVTRVVKGAPKCVILSSF